MVVEILRRVLPAAVENVGVNGYVSEHGIHQPNVTILHTCLVFTDKEVFIFFERGQEVGSFGSNRKKHMEKIKSVRRFTSKKYQENIICLMVNDGWCGVNHLSVA